MANDEMTGGRLDACQFKVTPAAVTAQRQGGAAGITALLFLVPFIACYAIDIFVLDRRPIHHLGDYSGVFSLGLGWLYHLPYVYFPWPLWGGGQISAAIIWLIERPVASLDTFYIIWAVLNVAATTAAAIMTGSAIRDLGLPPLSALVFGLVAATMPAMSVGWLNSNPYVLCGTLLVPASLVMMRRLILQSEARFAVYEYAALASLGWIVANNFGAIIVIFAAVIAACTLHPRLIGAPCSDRRSRTLREALALGLGLAFASGAGAIILRLDIRFILQAALLAVACLTAYAAVRPVCQRLAAFVVRPALAILAGWLLGVNVLVFTYVRAALVATGTASAPSSVSLHSLIPHIEWSQIAEGTHWFWLVPICYFGSVLLIILLLLVRKPDRIALAGASIFSLAVLVLVSVSTNAENSFPIGHSPIAFGRTGRYLWLGIATSTMLLAAILTVWRSSVVTYLVLLPLVGGGLLALEQSVASKRLIVSEINATILAADKAIDDHLAKSPRNLVLVANAYFPARAQVLYAYNNSVLASGLGEPNALLSGRIRHIGRWGGGGWADPRKVILDEGLAPDNILIIAEGADYPPEIEIDHRFENTDTYIAHLRTTQE